MVMREEMRVLLHGDWRGSGSLRGDRWMHEHMYSLEHNTFAGAATANALE